jgi:hypothetical protein
MASAVRETVMECHSYVTACLARKMTFTRLQFAERITVQGPEDARLYDSIDRILTPAAGSGRLAAGHSLQSSTHFRV